MLASTAVLLTLAAAAPSPPGRVLVCRSRVIGDVTGERGIAVAEAARSMARRFLDYGVVCDGAPEAARAARRAGLGRALASSVERAGELTRYVLSIADASLEREVARREVTVSRGQDAVALLRRALSELAFARSGEPPPVSGEASARSMRSGAGLAWRAIF